MIHNECPACGRRLATTRTAEEVLNVSHNTVLRMIGRDELVGARMTHSGRPFYLIDADDLERLAESMGRPVDLSLPAGERTDE